MLLNSNLLKKLLLLVGVTSGLSACATQIPGGSVCTSRIGTCFDAVIDGQPVEPLRNRSMIESYRSTTESASLKADLGYVNWIVQQPINGNLDVTTSVNKEGTSWFGTGPSYKVEFLPLNNQVIRSTTKLTQNSTVQAQGRGIVTQSHVAEEGKLPAGDYLVRIRMQGPSNWDLKHIFVKVAN